MTVGDGVLAAGIVPDAAIRAAIRVNLMRRLAREGRRPPAQRERFIESLRRGPIAESPAAPNEQHYEVPAAFFRSMLGPRLKYSSCYWPQGVASLAAAEDAMLALVCERARLVDGMDVLDLGCGWGSFALYAAERFPGSRVLALSNSAAQRASIDADAAKRGLRNLEVVTADVGEWTTQRRFDRVVSIEMLEHLRNWEALLAKVSAVLEPDGSAFVHVFSHRRYAYPYEDGWMARRFFTAGIMPSDDLIYSFQRDLEVVEHWRLSGRHYARTAEAWLAGLDHNAEAAGTALATVYGAERACGQLAAWRVFLMACGELWGYRRGSEWLVSHYLLQPRSRLRPV